MKRPTATLRFLPALCWASLIFFFSSRARLPDLPLTFVGVDKLAHAFVYAVLCTLLLWARQPQASPAALGWALVSAGYGITDELHQMFVPGRTADFLDFLADMAGSCFAAALWAARFDQVGKQEGA